MAFSVRPFVPLVVLVLVLVFIFRRPRGLSEAWFTAGGAALLAALGYLNATDIRAVLGQTAPTLAFLAGMLVVAFVADRAGVFRRIAERVAHRAGGFPVKLYVLL
ncbi:MAG: ArsB/NhaD family transporter, partial [Bacteroidota bacterium]